MNILVKKASLRSGIMLNYSYFMTDGDVKNSISISSDAPVHDDLKNAFRNMIPFFAHVCEEITKEKLVKAAIEDPEEHLEKKEDDPEGKEYPFLKYRVNGYELGGKDDGESIRLSGEKWLDSGDWISFTTPSMRLDSDYKFVAELTSAVDVLKNEVYAYMQGKQAPRQKQFSLLEEEMDESFQ